jgi:O-antigen ligase
VLKNRTWNASFLTHYAQSLSLPLAFVCVAALAVTVPWAMDPVHRTMRVFSVPKFTLINLLTTLGIAALLINDSLLNSLLRREGFPKKVLWLLGLWVAWMGITTALAIYPARSWVGSYEWQLGMFTQIHLIAVCGLTFLIVRRPQDGQRLLRIAVWGSVPVLIYGVIQYFGVDPIPWTRWGDAGSVIATLGNENYFGAYLAMLLPVTLSQVISAASRAGRALYCGMVILQVACLAVTRSNGAIIAALLACGIFLFWYWRRTMWLTKTLMASALALSLIVTLLIAVQGDAIGDGLVRLTNYGREVRPFTWESGLSAVAARPLSGWGLSSFDLTQAQYASPGFRINMFPMARVMDRVHNVWLEIALETGLAGLALWLTMMIGGGSAVLRAAERTLSGETRTMIVGCVAACFGYVIYQVVNPSDLATLTIFWWLIGLAFGLSFLPVVIESGNFSLPAESPVASFVLQALFLFTAVGAVYGFWQWAVN